MHLYLQSLYTHVMTAKLCILSLDTFSWWESLLVETIQKEIIGKLCNN